MNKFILIEVTNNIKRFIDKCKKYDIELYNVTHIDKNKIIVKINKEELELIKRYNYYSEIKIYKQPNNFTNCRKIRKNNWMDFKITYKSIKSFIK